MTGIIETGGHFLIPYLLIRGKKNTLQTEWRLREPRFFIPSRFRLPTRGQRLALDVSWWKRSLWAGSLGLERKCVAVRLRLHRADISGDNSINKHNSTFSASNAETR